MEKDIEKYRAFNFDLKLKLLREYYPKPNFLNAYKDIKRFMLENEFTHRQGSGYRSNGKMTDWQVGILVLEMREKLPWIEQCATKIDVTNIEEMYDIKQFFELHDENQKCNDLKTILRESEIKPLDAKQNRASSFQERMAEAKQEAEAFNKNKPVNIERETKTISSER